jgi:3-dehydroquinate dehydratase-2
LTKALVIQGPNMNMLGRSRPADYYGPLTLDDIHSDLIDHAGRLDATLDIVQSNHEGVLIDWLQNRQDDADLVVINPAGLCFYGDSLRQALVETRLPIGVVHMSEMWGRPDVQGSAFRKVDLFMDIASVYTTGLGWRGYRVVLEELLHKHFRVGASKN